MRESFAVDALVKDIRPAVFSALLTYLYTDTLQLERPEDIMELLVVANQVRANAGSLLWFVRGLLEIRPSQPPVLLIWEFRTVDETSLLMSLGI